MKQNFHNILFFLMAFVVLFSTMSFTVNQHYCGDSLVDSAIFNKVNTCGMEMQNPSTDACSITEKDCCKDETISIDGQDELQVSFDALSFNDQLFVASFIYTHINLFEGLENNLISYRDYTPPPLVKRQIFKLVETYII